MKFQFPLLVLLVSALFVLPNVGADEINVALQDTHHVIPLDAAAQCLKKMRAGICGISV